MNLSEMRKKRNMTQRELAERLGVAQNTISKWENGVSEPDIESMIKLCTVLKTSMDDLLGIQSFIESQTEAEIKEAMSASSSLSGLIAVLQTLPPDEVQKLTDVAKIILPQMKMMLDSKGNPLLKDLSPTIENLNSEEAITWQEQTPEPRREAELSDSAKTVGGKLDTP